MGGKKKKRNQPKGDHGGVSTAVAAMEKQEHDPASAVMPWGSKDGNLDSPAQNSVAAAASNSLELPSLGQNVARSSEPNHLSPQSDSLLLEQEVAKRNDSKKNAAPEPRPPEQTAPVRQPSAAKPSGGFLKRLFGGSSKPSSSNADQDDPTGPMITLF